MATYADRLEYLRGELRAQRISWSELHELQSLAEHIDPGDTELLEAAGVPEFPSEPDYCECSFPIVHTVADHPNIDAYYHGEENVPQATEDGRVSFVKTDEMREAEERMELKADVYIDARGVVSPAENGGKNHKQICIEWEGGIIWLDASDLGDHFCIDVRQFNHLAEMKAQGAFTIVNGRRNSFDLELLDTEKRVVKGHGWNGGYNVTLLTDKHGHDISIAPSWGNG